MTSVMAPLESPNVKKLGTLADMTESMMLKTDESGSADPLTLELNTLKSLLQRTIALQNDVNAGTLETLKA